MKIFIASLFICFGLTIGISVLAQDATADASAAATADENVQSSDLGVSDPKLLPDSPFYFLKNWGRGIQSFFTLDPVKKLELENKISNEKIAELKKIVEQGKGDEIIKKATENYQREIEKIKNRADKIKEKAASDDNVNKFLDKFAKQQALQEKILQKIQTKVSEDVFNKIEEARKQHLEKFGQVMQKLEDRKDEIQKKLQNSIENLKGSKFKNFKNLEILQNLQENAPKEITEAIQKAQETITTQLKDQTEKMTQEQQAKFKDYLEKITGDKEKQLQIMETLRQELKNTNETIKKQMIDARNQIINTMKENIKQACPQLTTINPESCKDGRIITKIDATGCPTLKCIIPSDNPTSTVNPDKPISACTFLWEPVCGKDGKTYSNKCFAKIAGAEIVQEGICPEKQCKTDADCPQLRCATSSLPIISPRCIGEIMKCIDGKCQIKISQ